MFACDKNVVTGSFMNFKTEGKKQKCRDVKDTELYCSYNVPALDDVACAEGEGDISGIEHLAAIKLARVVNLDVVAGLHTSAGWERKERKGHAGMRECIPYCIERVQRYCERMQCFVKGQTHSIAGITKLTEAVWPEPSVTVVIWRPPARVSVLPKRTVAPSRASPVTSTRAATRHRAAAPARI